MASFIVLTTSVSDEGEPVHQARYNTNEIKMYWPAIGHGPFKSFVVPSIGAQEGVTESVDEIDALIVEAGGGIGGSAVVREMVAKRGGKVES